MTLTSSPRPRTIQEQQAEDAFNRATKDSIQAARQQQARDRAEFKAQTGVTIDSFFRDGRIVHERSL